MTSLSHFLAGDYALLRTYLGDVAFTRLTETYARRMKGRALSLRRALARLPGFMARQSLWARHPEVVELARLEQAQNAALATPDLAALSPRSLASLAGHDGATLMLHPSASLLRFRTNAISLAAALRCGELPPPPARLSSPQSVLVWRQGDAPRFRVLGRAEEKALARLKRGLSASALLPELGLSAAQKKAPLQPFLTGWTEAGLLICSMGKAAAATPHRLVISD